METHNQCQVSDECKQIAYYCRRAGKCATGWKKKLYFLPPHLFHEKLEGVCFSAQDGEHSTGKEVTHAAAEANRSQG